MKLVPFARGGELPQLLSQAFKLGQVRAPMKSEVATGNERCALPSELLVASQVAPLAHGQRAQRDAPDAHAFQAGHGQADQFAHAADLALAAFAQDEAQLVLVLPRHARGLELDAVELQTVLQQ